jgi:hypothetical protein
MFIITTLLYENEQETKLRLAQLKKKLTTNYVNFHKW